MSDRSRPPATDRRGARLVTAVVGWVSALAILAVVPLSLVPINNPGVQDCGTPAAYLLRGRVNTLPDANDHVARAHGRIQTLTKAELHRAYDHPCSKQVAARMVPAAVSFAVGAVLGVVLLVVSMVIWWREAGPADPGPSDDPEPSAQLPVNSLS